MKKIAILVLAILSTAVHANGYWLNIPAYIDSDSGRTVPPTSYWTRDRDSCADAIVQYAKLEYVYYIGCDVNPLPNAVNVNFRRVK